MSDSVELKGTRLKETEKAVLFDIETVDSTPWEGNQKKYWIPFSQVTSSVTNPKVTGEDQLLISSWIAKRIGLI